MTADVTHLPVGPLIPGCTHAEVERLTSQYEAELACVGQVPPAAPPADEKRFATLQAQAALVGVQLHRIEGDDGRPLFVATKWAMSASFDSLDAAAAWLRRFVGVRVD